MNELTDMGNELLDYAENEAEFTAQRGLIDELFPFIYVASKRMSLRAISRWLADTKQVQISANALSKAMRKKEKYWQNIADDVSTAVLRFTSGYDCDPVELLKQEGLFEMFCSKQPDHGFVIVGDDPEQEIRDFYDSKDVIRDRWFSLPKEVRNICFRYVLPILNGIEGEKEHE